MKYISMEHQFGAPDYSNTVLAAKMCTKANEHSMYIRFSCVDSKCLETHATEQHGF
jgi:hypothetical protein